MRTSSPRVSHHSPSTTRRRSLRAVIATLTVAATCSPLVATAMPMFGSSDLQSLLVSPPPPEALSSSLFGVPSNPQRPGWKLVHEETFDVDQGVNNAAWVKDPHGDGSPWNVDEFDDDGAYYDVKGGPHFKRALNSFDLLRKRVAFGKDGWLTAELATRDRNKDGAPDSSPLLNVHDGVATLDIPSDTGLILTGTNPLPSQYRLEYELKTLDMGGKRNGTWNYDGKYNGYKPGDCQTNFPWVRKGDYSQGGADKPNPCEKPFGDITKENGYYLLEIVDYAHPAPHNNIFIHSHRKVGMDIYSVDAGWAKNYKVCNPKTGQLIDYKDSGANAINQIFFDGSRWRDKSFAYNEFVMPTNCGVRYGETKGATIVGTAELQPELMPFQTYKFAIERTDKGYVQEMTGNFKYIGYTTLRYFRPFVADDGRAIWHYNQTADEYDGRFNDELTFDGPFGSFKKQMWPKGSAYPDNFVIGIPHINYYTGTASVDNIRLYVPEGR